METLRNVEKREQQRNEVVRVLLFQSAFPEQLPEDADPATLELTRMVWTVKGGANATGMLMPVGGGRERKPNGQFSESVLDTAIREMIEETHAKTKRDRMMELPFEQEYSFVHKTSGDRRAQTARFCIGRLLPGDSMYALDQAEDKIASFAYLTPSQYKELLNTGSLTINGTKTQLIDHMQTSTMQHSADIQADWATADQVHAAAVRYFNRMEAIKKLRVLHFLLNGTPREDSTMDRDQLSHLRAAPGETVLQIRTLETALLNISDSDSVAATSIDNQIQQTTNLWQDVIRAVGATVTDIRQALEYSNTQGVLENVAEKFNEETGEGVPSVSLLFPLLAGDKKLNATELRILIKNPQAARLLKIVGTIRRSEGDSAEEIVKKLHENKLIPTDRLQDINRHTNEVDLFFENLQEQAAGIAIPGAEPVVISVAEEVRGRNVSELWDMILNPNTSLARIQDPHKRNIILWEAKRKLVLMLLMAEIDASHNELIAAGTTPFRDLEGALTTPESGRGARTLQLGPNRQEFPVDISSPPKSLAQALRKVIARDRSRGNRSAPEFLDDHNRSAYVFHVVQGMNVEHQQYVDVQTSGRVIGSDGTVIDPLRAKIEIAYLIQGFLQKAEEQGKNIRIINYKPLPEPGEKFDSSGGGGRGAIRMSKFDLEVTQPSGSKLYKEYQIFVPEFRVTRNEGGSTTQELFDGRDAFEEKKEDDKRRSMRRLFDTRGVRSAMEALFPVSVYGEDTRKIFRYRVGGDKSPKPEPKHGGFRLTIHSMDLSTGWDTEGDPSATDRPPLLEHDAAQNNTTE